jgi:hypothetical protein
MSNPNDEATDPRASVLPEAAHEAAPPVTSPIDEVPPAKARVTAALSSALFYCNALTASREAALVRTKIDEAMLWLSRCAE